MPGHAVRNGRLEQQGSFCEHPDCVQTQERVPQMIENAQEEHDVELFGQQIRKLIDRRLDELNLRAERG